MAKNEAAVKKQIHKDLKALGAWKFSPMQMGMGAGGIPDIICCKPVVITQEDVGKTFGLFVGIEAKIDYNKPTKLQMFQLKGIAAAGGMALVATGTTKKGLEYKLERIYK